MDHCLEVDLGRIVECGAMEIKEKNGKLFIPYMMNDAVECYYEFTDVVTQGTWDNEYTDVDFIDYAQKDDKYGIMVHQKDNIFSIWYKEVEKKIDLYQYHAIGHFWRDGEPLWRRLVYIVGTIHDKRYFMGEQYCTKEELEISQLIEFAPFRFWSPIEDDLDDYYINSKEGIEEMKHILDVILKEKMDKNIQKFYKKVEEYEVSFDKGKCNKKQANKLAMMMIDPANQVIYEYINRTIAEASLHYKEREYDKELKEKMLNYRNEIVKKYREKGYTGNYPTLTNGEKKVYFFEEHPFVQQQFEYDDFSFKIHEIIGGRLLDR